MISWPPTMIPVKTEHGEGYVLYINDGGGFENDLFTIVLCETGKIKHYNSQQVTIIQNLTYDIQNQ